MSDSKSGMGTTMPVKDPAAGKAASMPAPIRKDQAMPIKK